MKAKRAKKARNEQLDEALAAAFASDDDDAEEDGEEGESVQGEGGGSIAGSSLSTMEITSLPGVKPARLQSTEVVVRKGTRGTQLGAKAVKGESWQLGQLKAVSEISAKLEAEGMKGAPQAGQPKRKTAAAKEEGEDKEEESGADGDEAVNSANTSNSTDASGSSGFPSSLLTGTFKSYGFPILSQAATMVKKGAPSTSEPVAIAAARDLLAHRQGGLRALLGDRCPSALVALVLSLSRQLEAPSLGDVCLHLEALELMLRLYKPSSGNGKSFDRKKVVGSIGGIAPAVLPEAAKKADAVLRAAERLKSAKATLGEAKDKAGVAAKLARTAKRLPAALGLAGQGNKAQAAGMQEEGKTAVRRAKAARKDALEAAKDLKRAVAGLTAVAEVIHKADKQEKKEKK